MRQITFLGLALATMVLGCADTHGDADMVELILPPGDGEAGRKSFVELQCTSCHVMSGIADLPRPTVDSVAPDLTKSLRGQGRGQIATSILNPGHTSSIKVDMWKGWTDSQRIWLGPAPPPPPAPVPEGQERPMTQMVDYREVMTVRELCDLVTFLQTSAE